MSLDVLLCRVVSPAEANRAHAAVEYGSRCTIFSMVQPTGFVCVQEERIGRNCFNREWHTMYSRLSPGDYDDYDTSDVKDGELTPYGKLRIALTRAEFDDRMAPFIDTSEEGSWFLRDKLEQPWDFIWVCW